MSEGVGGVSGKAPLAGTGPMRNPYGALAVALVAIFPQLVLLTFTLITPVSFGYFHSTFAALASSSSSRTSSASTRCRCS